MNREAFAAGYKADVHAKCLALPADEVQYHETQSSASKAVAKEARKVWRQNLKASVAAALVPIPDVVDDSPVIPIEGPPIPGMLGLHMAGSARAAQVPNEEGPAGEGVLVAVGTPPPMDLPAPAKPSTLVQWTSNGVQTMRMEASIVPFDAAVHTDILKKYPSRGAAREMFRKLTKEIATDRGVMRRRIPYRRPCPPLCAYSPILLRRFERRLLDMFERMVKDQAPCNRNQSYNSI